MTTTTAKKAPAKSRRTSVPKTETATMSKAAAAALLGDGQAAAGTLVHLDPHSLTLDENVRKDVGMTAEFAADVAENGVMQPLLAHYDAVGQLLVYEGQRRLVAALEASTQACASVPVYITQAAGDREERISVQDRANRLRSSLTVKDQTATWQELAMFGRSAESIAKKQRAPVAQVQAALTVAGSKAAVTIAEQAPDLTLDQLAAIAEFDDDQEIQKELTDTAVNHPGAFVHSLQRRRDDRARARVRAAAVAEVEAAGVPLITDYWWSLRGGAELGDLLDKPGGKKLTPAAHTSCPGHAARVEVYAGAEFEEYSATIAYGCTAWVKHGHHHRHKDASASAKAADLPPEQAEAAKRERRAIRLNNKDSESSTLVRRRFVIDLLQRKTLPDDAPQALAEILVHHRDEGYGGRAVVDLLRGGGRTQPTAAQLGKSKRDATAWLLAATFARVEATMSGQHGKDYWRSQDTSRVAYLRRLKAWGYNLSALEAAYVANKVSELSHE